MRWPEDYKDYHNFEPGAFGFRDTDTHDVVTGDELVQSFWKNEEDGEIDYSDFYKQN